MNLLPIRHRLLRRLALPAVAVAAVAASGCSGTIEWPNGGGEPTGKTRTKVEFLERGNEILCDKSDRVIRAVTAQVLSGEEPSAHEEAELALPAMRTAYTQLAALPVPASERAEVSEILTAFRGAIATAEADPSVVSGASDPFGRLDRLMADYGLNGCA